MKTFILWMLFCCSVSAAYCQQPVTVFTDKGKDWVSIYAENKTICPVSIKINIEAVNMTYSYTNDYIVIPPQNARYHLVTLRRAAYNQAMRWKYNYKWYYGDVRNTRPDTSFIYELPYPVDSAYPVSQGYFGSFSHQTIRALDFIMPEGTPVLAARGGRVANVIQHHWQSCGQEDCAQYNNIITIYHNDGTFSAYAHLQQNSATVKIGDVVSQGQIIARSGNTGFSTTPHLHFWVFCLSSNGTESLETKFRVNKQILLLKQGYKYYNRRKESS